MKTDDTRTVTCTYQTRLDDWTSDLIATGVADFGVLLQSLPGVYPTEALASIERLAKRGEIHKRVLTAAQVYVAGRPNEHHSAVPPPHLPVPRPLDYSWRFSRTASERLLELSQELSDPEDTVVLLGVPSVYYAAVVSGFPRKMLLLDSDSATAASLAHLSTNGAVICADITGLRVPDVRTRIAIADPPWYAEHTRYFLWASSVFLSVGGCLLLCVPPAGTRPDVLEEWKATQAWARDLGFVLTRIYEGALSYISPPFERNALAACGIRNVPADWRRADLAVFNRKRMARIRDRARPRETAEWEEKVIEGVRIRVRCGDDKEFQDPSLVSVVEGDVLPSVSRRDPRRRKAVVWTSGNRVFGCKGPGILKIVLNAATTEQPAIAAVAESLGRRLTFAERASVNDAISQVMGLVALESQEMSSWHLGGMQ